MNVTSSCPGVHINASMSSGTIKSSHYFENSYSVNANCRWHFTSNAKLELVFLHFETDSSTDHVVVYDGKPAASPLIGTFSESSLPPPIMSSSNELDVTFTSDGIKQGAKGFSAIYRGKSITIGNKKISSAI